MKKLFLFVIIFLFLNALIFPVFFEYFYKQALELSWSGNYEKSEELFEELMRMDNTNKDMIISYTNLLGWQGKFDKAKILLLNFENQDYDIKSNLAKIYFWAEEFDQAYEIYSFLKDNDYDLEENALEFIKIFGEYGIFTSEEAKSTVYKIQYGDTLFSISRKTGISVNEIIQLNNLKEPYKIIEGQELKLSLNYDSLFSQALYLSRIGQFSRAEEIFDKLLILFKNDELLIAYSNNLAWQEKYSEAIKFLKNYDSHSNDILNQLGKISVWNSDFDEAYKHYKKLYDVNYTLNREVMDFIQQYEHFNNIPLSFDWSSGYYEIRKGDTLFNISVKIGINVEEIIKLNNLKEPYTLYPSQKLKIK